MTPQTIPQTVLFPDLFDKPLVATFDRQHASSDVGAVLLKAAERVYGLVAGFARCLVDRRELGKIRHTLTELLGQRIFGIACGHPDGNDADHLADDPIHKLQLGRHPVAGEALASQPTISRFENGVGRSALYELVRELAMRVIERHQRRLDGQARRITIDLDPTDDATHGAQQLTFFNGHYDSWCYLPLLAFLTFDQEREQYLCAAVLRPGNVPATRGTVGVLCPLLPLLRQAFPQARFLVRLDGGFAEPEIFDFLDAEPRLDYVVAMAKNAVLQRHAEPALLVAQAQSAASGQTAHVYTDTQYQAGTWGHARRGVIKAEVVRLRTAKMRHPATLEAVDFTHPRRLNRQQVLTLGACAWIAERHNLILIGPTGIGKSFLCCAFVERACRRGFTARYIRMPRLLHELAVGRGDGSYARLLTRLAKLDLLAIDDWMIAPLRDAERRELTEVIEDRAERASTLIASQLPVTDWHAVIGDANQADAICDHLLHDAHRIELQGRSMRRTHRTPKTRTPETR